MERTQMIGMLKALGGGNKFIRSIFVYNGISLIAKGLLLGNLIGLGLVLHSISIQNCETESS
jgi:lipoprotein-releasing system permease protein